MLVAGDTIDQKLTSEQKKVTSEIPLDTFIDRQLDAMEHTGDPSPTDVPPYVLELTGNTRKLLQHVGEIGVFNFAHRNNVVLVVPWAGFQWRA